VTTIRSRIPASPARVVAIHVGRGLVPRLASDVANAYSGARAIVVSDDRVAPLHGDVVRRALVERGLRADLIVFPAGEVHKTRETKARLEDELAALGLGRDAVVVAVGGGVTGDLAGFLAATWHRGVPVVQVPTSLLAMVDAALGGKTGVDTPAGKNLVGAFWHTVALYADLDTLATLPEEHYVLGFAEVVKSFAVADAAAFSRLERSVAALRSRDPDRIEDVVRTCLSIKARIVSRDPRDEGRRAILNFGHTVGHAVETASSWRIPHGAAVALGLSTEAVLASRVRGFPDAHRSRLRSLLAGLGLPATRPAGVVSEDVIAATRRDKKNRAGRTRYALPLRIGRMLPGSAVTVEVDETALAEALHRDD
jgi:3-dehydroquinate synthase